ncbi:hypothetical protein L1D09_21585 [Vibrio tubiashii]|uniref:lipopolysaccharide biosynthesis protein n=2 Tax=Vibrio tubiashii TaxID=29498 RepID=UPI001EFECB18|nr:hypothetical protein [Vibrio tubiashii]MCG9584123.1 hypothetical protein [Vibrio tubiashii]MCG9617718.1 hypothetical protein [Vibrio tubiashii]
MMYILLMLFSAIVTGSKGLYLPYLLDVPTFGSYSVYLQMVSILAPIVALGIPDAFFLEYQKVQYAKKQVVAKTYSYSFYTTILVCALICIILYNVDSIIGKQSGIAGYACLTLGSQVVFYWLMRTIRFQLNTKKFAFYNLLRVSLDLGLILVLDGMSLITIFYIEAFSFALVSLLMMITEKFKLSYFGFLSLNRLCRYIKVGFLVVIGGFLSNFFLMMDRVFVSYFYSEDFIGRYNLLLLPMSFAFIFYNIFYQYFLPKANSLVRIDGDIEGCRKIIRQYQAYLILAYFVLAVPIMMLLKNALIFVYHVEFSYVEIFILSLSVLFYLLNIYDVVYISFGKVSNQVFINVFLSLFYFVALLLMYFNMERVDVLDFMVVSVFFRATALLLHYRKVESGFLAQVN